jgi:hypothetical protein
LALGARALGGAAVATCTWRLLSTCCNAVAWPRIRHTRPRALQDQPGQKVMWSATADGVTWSSTNTTTNVLFPSMNSTQNPGVALFAEPALYINGRYYVAASPTQFCLYPVSLLGVCVAAV